MGCVARCLRKRSAIPLGCAFAASSTSHARRVLAQRRPAPRCGWWREELGQRRIRQAASARAANVMV